MKWPTNNDLTDKQMECVNYPADKNILVRGIAGSGKSLVIVKRAIKISRKERKEGHKPRIIIYTYVKSLVKFMDEVLREGGENAEDIEVSTLDSNIVSLYRKMTGQWKLNGLYKAHRKEMSQAIQEASVMNPDNRFLKEDMREFVTQEIAWMKQQGIDSQHDYEVSPRKGRGKVRIGQKDRQLIYNIYKNYYRLLEENNFFDIDVICEEIYRRREQIPDEEKYDYVMIDEAQDLPLDKMLVAKALTRKAMTISADFAQKIYQTGFTWKEVGINIRGQASKKLKGTFRNTQQIAMLANSLSQHNTELASFDEDDAYSAPEIPERPGPKPVLTLEPSAAQEENDVRTLVENLMEESPDATIAVLSRDYDYTKKFEQWFSGLDYQKIDKNGEYQILEPGLKLVTYHSAKGLEFDVVILPMVNNGLFPYTKKNEGAEGEVMEDLMNNARNLLFVGITRARRQVYIFAENGADGTPSPLINEMDKNYLDVRR